MRRFTKADVEMYSGGYGRAGHPAINVKVHDFPSADEIVDRFGCSEATAMKAGEYAFAVEQEVFWEGAKELARELFGNVKVYSAGRSGGWLVVEGLPDVGSWDAITVLAWGRFERQLKADIASRTSKDSVFDGIEANEWAMDDASLTAMLVAASA